MAERHNWEQPLYRLPNEIFHEICRMVIEDYLQCAHAYEPFRLIDEMSPDFIVALANLVNLGRTSRRFRQTFLSRFMASVVLKAGETAEGDYLNLFNAINMSSNIKFAEKLKSLYFEEPEGDETCERPMPENLAQLVTKAQSDIDNSKFDWSLRNQWINSFEFSEYQAGALAGVILMQTPNLERLSIKLTTPDIAPMTVLFSGPNYMRDVYYRDGPVPIVPSLEGLGEVQGLNNLRYLKVTVEGSLNLYGLRYLKNLKTLDVTFKYILPGSSIPAISPHGEADYEHIENLHLNCRLKESGSTVPQWLLGLRQHFRRFENLRLVKFYGETEEGQREIVRHRNWSPDDRVRFKSALLSKGYDALLELLKPQESTLESLELPGGFWALQTPSGMLPATRLRYFRRLQHLTTPIAALVGTKNVGQIDFDMDRDETPQETQDRFRTRTIEVSHIDMLPTTLKSLTVYDADEQTCKWLEGIFSCKEYAYRDLTKVSVILMKNVPHDKAWLAETLSLMADGTGVEVEVR